MDSTTNAPAPRSDSGPHRQALGAASLLWSVRLAEGWYRLLERRRLQVRPQRTELSRFAQHPLM